jgi:hypothetical protein
MQAFHCADNGSQSGPAVELMCCYAQADKDNQLQFETYIQALQREGLISSWHDRPIRRSWSRAKASEAVDEHVETAAMILLLISAHFLASGYCSSTEMRRAMERHKAHEAHVIPVILRPCDLRAWPMPGLEPLPRDAWPISTRTSAEDGWAQVAAELRSLLAPYAFTREDGNLGNHDASRRRSATRFPVHLTRIITLLAESGHLCGYELYVNNTADTVAHVEAI